ncbi:T9SS type A sorting domain-containing protein [bacterium]|nr:T9SS type A sorting domain-containing protein [bacterium]
MNYLVKFAIKFLLIILLIVPAQAEILQEIFAPDNSYGLIWDGRYLWVGLSVDNNDLVNLHKIDVDEMQIVETFAIEGEEIRGIGYDGRFLWVYSWRFGNNNRDEIYKIDPETGEIVHSFETPFDTNPYVGGMCWMDETLWLSRYYPDNPTALYQIDTEDGSIIGSTISPHGQPQGITWDGDYLWMVGDDFNNELATIYQIHPFTGEVLHEFPALGDDQGDFVNPRGMSWTEDGNLWMVGNNPDSPTGVGFFLIDPELPEQGEPHQFNKPLEANRFELVSMNLDPGFDPGILNSFEVFASIEDEYVIVLNDEGNFMIPWVPEGFNCPPTEAWKVFCSEPAEWTLEGIALEFDTEYNIEGNRWNWIGHPYREPYPVELAMATIADDIQIVLNDDGEFWIPNLVNALGDLSPNDGYYVFSTVDLDFTYAEPDLVLAKGFSDNTELPFASDAPIGNGQPWVLLVTLDESLRTQNPATVEVRDGDKVVGKSVIGIESKLIPVICWEGNSHYNLSGFEAGNEILFTVTNETSDQLSTHYFGSTQRFGDQPYGEITLASVSSTLPGDFKVANAFPNPFNPSFSLEIQLPRAGFLTLEIVNLIGQSVYQHDYQLTEGFHELHVDPGVKESQLSSGTYLLKTSFNNDVHFQKIVLLR